MSASASIATALARWNERIRRALGWSRPMLRVAADLRMAVPAWALRGVQLAVVLGCVAVAAPNALGWLIGIVFGGLMVALPRPFWTAVFAIWSGLVVLDGTEQPFQPGAIALLFGVHLLLVLGTALDRIPLSARVEPAVLLAPARRFLALQAFSQALALAAAWVTSAQLSVVWVAVAAAVLVAVVMWVLVARLTDAADGDEWQ